MVYVDPITTILGQLQVVWAGDTRTIPFEYQTAMLSGVNCFNAQLARADSQPALEVIWDVSDVTWDVPGLLGMTGNNRHLFRRLVAAPGSLPELSCHFSFSSACSSLAGQ